MSWRTVLGVDPFAGTPGDFDTASRAAGPRAGSARNARARTHGARMVLLAIVALVAVVVLIGTVATIRDHRSAARYPVTAGVLAVARTELATLRTTAQPPRSRYDRTAFGQAWADVDRNGCDTRNDILARDLTQTTYQASSAGCIVATGVLADPYTGRTFSFERGEHSAEVQIDHVVALANAWASGASRWDPTRRRQLANDPRNLLAVDGPANQEKSASDASQWLPANTGYRCIYVVRQIDVKTTYRLTVTAAEAAAMARTLDGCVVAPG